jgi:hypothetical protein
MPATTKPDTAYALKTPKMKAAKVDMLLPRTEGLRNQPTLPIASKFSPNSGVPIESTDNSNGQGSSHSGKYSYASDGMPMLPVDWPSTFQNITF